jgi:hypothetical protein
MAFEGATTALCSPATIVTDDFGAKQDDEAMGEQRSVCTFFESGAE